MSSLYSSNQNEDFYREHKHTNLHRLLFGCSTEILCEYGNRRCIQERKEKFNILLSFLDIRSPKFVLSQLLQVRLNL